jgi:hypothetical protein
MILPQDFQRGGLQNEQLGVVNIKYLTMLTRREN